MKREIGFVGLGKMGLPMAEQLLNQNFHVYGVDPNEKACQSFSKVGGIPSSLKQVVESADTIILMLPNSTIVNETVQHIKSYYVKEDGSRVKDLTIIDMSSSFPIDTKRNLEMLTEVGIQLLDAPVSGGMKKAISGELTIMVGGDKNLFDENNDLLSKMGSNIYHLGPIGSGHLLKSLNNFLSAVHMLATCEVVQALDYFGIEPEKGIEVINNSSGRSGSSEYKFPNFVFNETYNSGFSLDLLAKDLTFSQKIFEEIGENSTLVKEVTNTYLNACDYLEANADHTEIFHFVSSYLNIKGEKFHV